MNARPVAQVLDALFANEIAVRPHWYQPGAPKECWLFAARTDAWLVVFDPSNRRVVSASKYTERALREKLPSLAGANVPAHAIVERSTVDPSLGELAATFVARRERALDALRGEPRDSLASTLHNGATSHLCFSREIGWTDVIVHEGKLLRHAPIEDAHAESLIDTALYERETIAPERMDGELRSALGAGESRYRALCRRMRDGELGWAVHNGLLVVQVDDLYYNTTFSGDTATGFTKFRPGYLLSEMLLASTVSDALPAAAKPLGEAKHGSARALVAKLTMAPEALLAKLEAGELSLAGGGPTSEDVWMLDCAAGRFAQRFAYGEVREVTREEALAILTRRGYSTMRWR
ncbi:MAG: hypothetical protein JNK05_02120 [Myxococcales bacterium]|nr:hypothetical protein [Myxococcales bacterium]